jgi:hypothetical protein
MNNWQIVGMVFVGVVLIVAIGARLLFIDDGDDIE